MRPAFNYPSRSISNERLPSFENEFKQAILKLKGDITLVHQKAKEYGQKLKELHKSGRAETSPELEDWRKNNCFTFIHNLDSSLLSKLNNVKIPVEKALGYQQQSYTLTQFIENVCFGEKFPGVYGTRVQELAIESNKVIILLKEILDEIK